MFGAGAWKSRYKTAGCWRREIIDELLRKGNATKDFGGLHIDA